MSVGVFTEKKNRPSDEEMVTMIGAMLPAWIELAKFLRASYSAKKILSSCMGKITAGH